MEESYFRKVATEKVITLLKFCSSCVHAHPELPAPITWKLLHFQPSVSAWEDAEEAPREEGPLSSSVCSGRQKGVLLEKKQLGSEFVLFCFNKSLDLWAVNGTEVEIGL